MISNNNSLSESNSLLWWIGIIISAEMWSGTNIGIRPSHRCHKTDKYFQLLAALSLLWISWFVLWANIAAHNWHIVAIRWGEEGHTMKYGFRPRDCPRAEPEGNTEGKNHISWYVLTRVNVLTLYHYENQHISWYGLLARTIFHDMVRSSGLYFMIWFARADHIIKYFKN